MIGTGIYHVINDYRWTDRGTDITVPLLNKSSTNISWTGVWGNMFTDHSDLNIGIHYDRNTVCDMKARPKEIPGYFENVKIMSEIRLQGKPRICSQCNTGLYGYRVFLVLNNPLNYNFRLKNSAMIRIVKRDHLFWFEHYYHTLSQIITGVVLSGFSSNSLLIKYVLFEGFTCVKMSVRQI